MCEIGSNHGHLLCATFSISTGEGGRTQQALPCTMHFGTLPRHSGLYRTGAQHMYVRLRNRQGKNGSWASVREGCLATIEKGGKVRAGVPYIGRFGRQSIGQSPIDDRLIGHAASPQPFPLFARPRREFIPPIYVRPKPPT